MQLTDWIYAYHKALVPGSQFSFKGDCHCWSAAPTAQCSLNRGPTQARFRKKFLSDGMLLQHEIP